MFYDDFSSFDCFLAGLKMATPLYRLKKDFTEFEP